jgi:hypothetical protein
MAAIVLLKKHDLEGTLNKKEPVNAHVFSERSLVFRAHNLQLCEKLGAENLLYYSTTYYTK